jgi:subfamily B ATP-binding cassette protein MsbA
VDSFWRVFPFVWPHRRKVLISTVFAFLVALFWGLNLTAAFPVVKVLLQGQGLGEYVDNEIVEAETETHSKTAKLASLDEQLEELNGRTDSWAANERVRILKDRTRQQEKLRAASKQLMAMTWLKSNVLPYLPKDRFDMLVGILLCVVIATILKGLSIFVQELLIGSVVELTVMGIRRRCFRKILELDYQTISLDGTSELMSRFTYDLTILGTGLKLLGGKVIREPLKAAACLCGAFYVSWQLTLLSMLFVPLAGLIFYRIGRKLKQASHRMMESMSRIYKTLEETLDAFKIVIAFNAAGRHKKRFRSENESYYAKAMRIVKVDALTSPTTEVLGMLAAMVALLPGAYLVLRSTNSIWGIRLVSGSAMDVAELTLLYVFLAGMIDPARKLSTIYAKLKRATAAADRIFQFLDRESLVKQPKKPQTMPRHQESVEFRNICFAYANGQSLSDSTADDDNRPSVLDGVSLKVTAGEVIVVVGGNGSGKSTLVNLLPRFFDADSGQVLIDGVDITQVRLRALRSQISIVTQETLLFDDTIYNNISYGKPNASREEIEEAARRANALPFIEQLSEGFDTSVGEKGQRLSGGQRQRVALARAMLREPSILILDEATSAIDASSERLIHEALRDFVAGRTTFLITHSVSPSILDFVSRIAVMDEGRLIAVGTHKMLIDSCSVYQRLFHAQVQQGASATA